MFTSQASSLKSRVAICPHPGSCASSRTCHKSGAAIGTEERVYSVVKALSQAEEALWSFAVWL